MTPARVESLAVRRQGPTGLSVVGETEAQWHDGPGPHSLAGREPGMEPGPPTLARGPRRSATSLPLRLEAVMFALSSAFCCRFVQNLSDSHSVKTARALVYPGTSKRRKFWGVGSEREVGKRYRRIPDPTLAFSGSVIKMEKEDSLCPLKSPKVTSRPAVMCAALGEIPGGSWWLGVIFPKLAQQAG